ncbi:MAG TPA: hypothetical protein VGN42_04260 [Pirellulales bacterium]|nr:hypothetical protein [Pirellulales bacterium]
MNRKTDPSTSSKRINRVTAPRKLTAEEAAEDRRLCELAEKDRDEIVAQGRKLLAEKRGHEVK